MKNYCFSSISLVSKSIKDFNDDDEYTQWMHFPLDIDFNVYVGRNFSHATLTVRSQYTLAYIFIDDQNLLLV